MWSIQDVSAEKLAKLFHHYREALSHDSGYDNGEVPSWEDAPQRERRLMLAAARLTLLELTTASVQDESRPYFAKPGEAEWGC
jgi:hypothetical protein